MIGCPGIIGGSAYVPQAISGLQLWLAADMIPGATHLATVSTWPDKSGYGRDATQGTPAITPTFNTASGPNSKPCIVFPTTKYYDITMPTNLTAGEIFAVLKVTAEGSNLSQWDFGQSTLSSHYSYGSGVVYEAFGSSGRFNTGDPTANITAWHLYNVRSATNAYSTHINGTQHYSSGSNTVGWKATAGLGRGTVSEGFTWNGSAAEIIVYNSVLSAGNRTLIHNYLATKYGLTIA